MLVIFFLFSNITYSATTNIILVRHAEKLAGRNPPLTVEGQRRAQSLVKLLEVFDISAIYSSNYQRTIMTSKPLANALELDINITFSPTEYKQILDDIVSKNSGNTVLIVGHSNTIPKLVNYALTDNVFPDINDKNYSDLYLLKYDPAGESKVLKFSYSMKKGRLILRP